MNLKTDEAIMVEALMLKIKQLIEENKNLDETIALMSESIKYQQSQIEKLEKQQKDKIELKTVMKEIGREIEAEKEPGEKRKYNKRA